MTSDPPPPYRPIDELAALIAKVEMQRRRRPSRRPSTPRAPTAAELDAEAKRERRRARNLRKASASR